MLSFFEQYAIPPESHPLYSPNLNPIEHAWVLLKQAHINHPWIGDYPGGPQKVKENSSSLLGENSSPAVRGSVAVNAWRVKASRQRDGALATITFCISRLSTPFLLSIVSRCVWNESITVEGGSSPRSPRLLI